VARGFFILIFYMQKAIVQQHIKQKKKAGEVVKGLVHIYTGDGKGKTTAALGLGMRAYGSGLVVLMVQFLKSMETGEKKVIDEFLPGFKMHRGKGASKFTWDMTPDELKELKAEVHDLFKYAQDAALKGDCDLLILDEILGCIAGEFLSVKEVTDFLKNKPEGLEVVLTGRNAPSEIIELADYVSEIKCIKHPYQKGIPGRKGIEF